MKKNYSLTALFMLLFVVAGIAQQGINYKAIIKDGEGYAIANSTVTVQFTILENGTTNVYQETHDTITDANGIVIVNIGEGTVVSGVFDDIDWGSNPHYLNTKINTGSGLTDMGTTEFKTVPYALHAKTVETEMSALKTYSVGDYAQGGVVFWVDETGQHGLVCAIDDQSTGIRWYAGTNGVTQAKGDGLFAGKTNTSIIIAAQVAIGDDGETYAARLCNELQVVMNGNTYGDWYLPSKKELYLISQNRITIEATAIENGGSAFGFYYYWSSTEIDDNKASSFLINLGNAGLVIDKFNTHSVRAIRAF